MRYAPHLGQVGRSAWPMWHNLPLPKAAVNQKWQVVNRAVLKRGGVLAPRHDPARSAPGP
jgi:hypothetical protein